MGKRRGYLGGGALQQEVQNGIPCNHVNNHYGGRGVNASLPVHASRAGWFTFLLWIRNRMCPQGSRTGVDNGQVGSLRMPAAAKQRDAASG